MLLIWTHQHTAVAGRWSCCCWSWWSWWCWLGNWWLLHKNAETGVTGAGPSSCDASLSSRTSRLDRVSLHPMPSSCRQVSVLVSSVSTNQRRQRLFPWQQQTAKTGCSHNYRPTVTQSQAIPFEWLCLATSFSIWRYAYIFRYLGHLGYLSYLSKVMGPHTISHQRKSGSVQLKNYSFFQLQVYLSEIAGV